jgi:hypothetical protein
MSKNVDDFFDDTKTMKSFRFRTFWLTKPSTPKYSSLKTFQNLNRHIFVVSELNSVRHTQYVCTNGIGVQSFNS